MWKIHLSKETDKFITKENIFDTKLKELIQNFIKFIKGENVKIDVKKMKGNWKGYYRIKMGKFRIILKVEFETKTIFIERIDYRGSVYK